MRIIAACGRDGLLEYRDTWRRLPCPLACPTQLAARPGGLAAADESARLLWTGQAVHPIDGGLEALALTQCCALTLSGDTDSLTLMDAASGDPLVLVPAGVYPQDFCFVDHATLAVCGGMDGKVRLMSLPELRTKREFNLPGATQRIACSGGQLHVLCLAGEDPLHTLFCRIPLPQGQPSQVCAMPGLPGAVCADGRGGIWLGVSEHLAHFLPRACAPDVLLSDFGLIRRMARMGDSVLVSDPVMGLCAAADLAGHVHTLLRGDVQQAIVTE